jgi:hypothetical protein
MRDRGLVISVLAAMLLAGCAMHSGVDRRPVADDRVGAAVANVWYVPGRAIVCGTTAVLAAAAMTLTFGHVYEDASYFMHGACAGPWTVRAEEVREAAADR